MASRYSSEVLAVITAEEQTSTSVESTLRIALFGGMYEDTESPSGPDVHYQGRIKSDVILDKKIGVVFWGESSEIDFGFLDVAVEDQNAALIDFADKVTVATVDFYRVNISDPAVSRIELLSSSRSADIGFVDENTIRFRLESTLQGGFDAEINQYFYDNTYPHLEGRPYPIAWGPGAKTGQLLPTVFVDDVSLLYHVTDLDIVATPGTNAHPYDQGIALPTTGSGGEFDLLNNGFELNQNPAGKITWGNTIDNDWLVDPEDTGNALLGLFRITRLAMVRAGIWDNAIESDLETLDTNYPEEFPFYHTFDVTSLQDFMDYVFNGFGGWYYVDEFSNIRFGRLTDPGVQTPALQFTDANVIGDIAVDDDLAPCLSTRISYADNPGAYDPDELAGGVSNADRILMTTKEYTVETTENVDPFYACHSAQKPIHFAHPLGATVASRSSALDEVNRWWSDLYPERRRFYKWTVLINDPLFDDTLFEQWTADSVAITADSIVHTADGSSGAGLGNNPLPKLGVFCTLQSDRFDLINSPINLLIRRTRFNFSTGLMTLEGWG